MNYVNYDTKIIELYQTKLIGWTYCKFKSPFDIQIRMTKSDMNNHRDEVEKRKSAGETVGKARKSRSDKGIKRPQKKAPGVGEDDGDEDDGAPPAKKQKKTKELHTTTTKKAHKKSRKSQLPPTHPTSHEFVDSDANVDAA
jgi:hypothetical protein